MLTKEQKKELVKKLSKEITDSKSVIICDFKGLTVAEISELRKNLREHKATMQVMKKTLIQHALKDASIEMDIKNLEGQIAIIHGGEDEVSPSKVAYDFSKDHESLKILKGVLEQKELAGEEMIMLAKLPSKEELLTKVVGSIKAPISGLVNVLSGTTRNLVYVLSAIKESKE